MLPIADCADLVVVPTRALNRLQGKGFTASRSAQSQAIEEGEQRVGWPVSARMCAGRGDSRDGSFLLLHGGVGVDLRGGDLLVTEPEP
jgi:hypothetical protein